MPRRGENIYKRKDKRWEARILLGYTPEGKRKYHSIYGKSYKEVKIKRDDYLTNYPVENNSSDSVFEKPLEYYINIWLLHQKTKVKTSTYSTYIRILNSQVLPALGRLELQNITSEIVEQFLCQKAENGRLDGTGGLSAKSCADLTILLNSIFSYIAKEYHYPNPMDGVKHIASQKKSHEPLSQSESDILTHFLYENTDTKNAGILLCLYMGLRLGEICGLQWENIDLERQIIKIRQTVYRVLNENTDTKAASSKTSLILSTPKTNKSIRDIPIPAFLLPYLQQLKTESEYYLLTGTEQPMEPRTYQYYFKRILKMCSIRNVPFHCLRHTFATNCVILGFDIKTLSEILGHSNTRITLERYVHSSFYQKQLQMMKLSNSVIFL